MRTIQVSTCSPISPLLLPYPMVGRAPSSCGKADAARSCTLQSAAAPYARIFWAFGCDLICYDLHVGSTSLVRSCTGAGDMAHAPRHIVGAVSRMAQQDDLTGRIREFCCDSYNSLNGICRQAQEVPAGVRGRRIAKVRANAGVSLCMLAAVHGD